MKYLGYLVAAIAAIVMSGLVLVASTGCTRVNAQKTVDNVRDAVAVSTAVCDSVELFEKIGLDAPGAEQCQKVLPYLRAEDMQTVFDVAECLTLPDKTEVEIAECIQNNGGFELARTYYRLVRDKIKQ